MRNYLLLFLLLLPALAWALPDDATLSKMLIGTWDSSRHQYEYRRDGTWITDPPDDGYNSRGKWRIENGKLITTWRFQGESKDSSDAQTIVELTKTTLKTDVGTMTRSQN
ncbi:MAG TPA: hypothetical protein VLK27_10515 [Chthoniobacterales bacterium]|nr:hypothetical protein [Chthoniobacterales bacterium]